LGLMFSRWGVDALVALSPEKLPRLQEVHINAGVLAFAALSTVLTATIFGLAPALATLRSDINKSLKDGDRGATPGGSRARLRHWLVATEVALSVVLLAGAGLLMRTFVNLQHVNAGFQPSQVLTFRTNLPIKRYPDDVSFIRFYQSLLARLQILPGVQSVGDSSDIPWTGYDANTDFQIEGRATDPNHSPEATYHFASPDYFRAIGTPLLSGRFFTPADTADAPKVFMINSALARRYFPGEDPVGKRLGMWGFKGITIVGVVGDVKETPDAQQAKPSLYWCDSQFDDHGERVVVMRTNAGPSVAASAIQREVFALDKDLPITDVKMMDEIGAHAISNARFTLLLVGAFAGLAVLLAAIGIFGVMAYSVTQRTHEIGVRMALGAQQQDVLGMVVGQGAKLAATGVASGLIAALFLTRVMVSLLYGVSAYDPWTFACVAALLIVVALVACYLPARRAARVDPMIALRHE
jgi:predicted permease